jgi:hypothetical protein
VDVAPGERLYLLLRRGDRILCRRGTALVARHVKRPRLRRWVPLAWHGAFVALEAGGYVVRCVGDKALTVSVTRRGDVMADLVRAQ